MKNLPTVVPVVAAALIDESGQVLIQQRREGRSHSGLWEFPGGKAESGESLESALVRELDEELSIRIDPASLEPLSFASSPDQPYVVLLYTCCKWTGQPQALDAQALRWCQAEEMLQLPLVPLDIPLAHAVAQYMKRLK